MSTYAQRYEQLVALFKKELAPEQSAALFLLSSDEVLCNYVTWFISPRKGLDYEALKNSDTIRGVEQNMLAQVAFNLYSRGQSPCQSPYELSQMPYAIFSRCRTAMCIASGEYFVHIVEYEGERELIVSPVSWGLDGPDDGIER